MLISCPVCQSRYLIPDTAIGPIGRPVRCGACKHSWMQMAPDSRTVKNPPAAAAPPPAVAKPRVDSAPELQSENAVLAGDMGESKAPPPLFHRIDMPPLQGSVEALAQNHQPREERPAAAAIAADVPNWVESIEDWQEPQGQTAWMNSAHRRYRRNMTRYYSIAAIFTGILLIGANVLLWKSDFTQNIVEPGLLGAQSTALQLRITEVPRAAFQPNGDIEQPITVRIDNPTDRVLPIPRMRAQMMDSNNQTVYVWTFAARQSHLPAGKSLSVHTRATNFPTNPQPVRLSLEFIDNIES